MTPSAQLKSRSLLTLNDLSDEEMLHLLDLSVKLKRKKKTGERGDLLDRKNIAMVFEKMSTRTRCAAFVAAADEGGCAEFLSSAETHVGKKESIADTARVLGQMFDGIFFRGYAQKTVELLAQYAGIPVWNGLTDDCHPTQTLADLMTVKESFGRLQGLKLVYVGDGRNNVANSLMLGCAKAGLSFVNCTPTELTPCPDLVEHATGISATNGGSVTIDHNPVTAVAGANVVCTDVWVSMGEEAKQEERLALLSPYQVNMEMMRNTGNLEEDQAIFLHCLPAFHDNNTELTKDTGAQEVTNEVFEAPFSKVFREAGNRVHTIKAVFVASLTDHA